MCQMCSFTGEALEPANDSMQGISLEAMRREVRRSNPDQDISRLGLQVGLGIFLLLLLCVSWP